MTTKAMYVIGIALLAVGLASAASAWPLNESEQPGSVIVFHKFIGGTTPTPTANVPRTTFEISAVCPPGLDPDGAPVACALNQTINLRAHWVCPGAQDTVCQENDFNLSLTVNGTVVFDAAGPGGNGVAIAPPCERGYLVVWVIDDSSQGNPIKFDGLIGDAVIRTGFTSARAYNALPIQAGEWIATGQQTAADTGGALAFDGDHYKAVTGKIYGGVRYEDVTHATSLTLLTLDVRSNAPNPLTTATLNFYNENEELISTGRNFYCWTQDRLQEIDPNLNTNFGGRGGIKGLVESTSASQDGTPVTLLGIVETEETVVIPVEIPVPGQTVTTTVPFPVQPVGAACANLPNPPFCTINRVMGVPPFSPVCVSATCRLTVAPQTVTRDIFTFQDHAYSLYHDGNPVPTTFFPIPVLLPQW